MASCAKARYGQIPVLLTCEQVWPLASLINYRYVPLHLRVPYVSVLALCW